MKGKTIIFCFTMLAFFLFVGEGMGNKTPVQNAQRKINEQGIENFIQKGVLYCRFGNFDSAQIIIDSAENFLALSTNISKTVFAKWHYTKAYLEIERGNVDNAIYHNNKARELYQSEPDSAAWSLVMVGCNLGRAYIIGNQLDSAEMAIKDAFKKVKNAKPEQIDSTILGIMYNNLGAIYFYRNQLDSAESYYDKSRTISSMHNGAKSVEVGRALYNIGLVRNMKGYYPDAIHFFEQAFEIYHKHLGDKHPQMAELYGAMGSAYLGRKEWGRAIYYFTKDMETVKAMHGNEHPDIAYGLKSLGDLYLAKGQKAEAESYLKQALAINIKGYGNLHTNVSGAHLALAELYQTGDTAEFHARKTIEIEAALTDGFTYNTAIAWSILSKLSLQNGKLNEALSYSDTALVIAKKLDKNGKSELISNLFLGRSNIYEALQNTETAFTAVEKAILASLDESTQKIKDVSVDDVIFRDAFLNATLRKTELYWSLYKRTNDPSYLDDLIREIDLSVLLIQQIQLESTSEEASLERNKLFSRLYSMGLKAAVASWQINARPRNFEKAFYYAELLKNKSLSESVRGLDAFQVSDIPVSTQRREYQLKKDLVYYMQLLSETDEEEERQNIRKELERLHKEQQRFNDNLKKFHPEYFKMKYAFVPVNGGHLQKKSIKENQALISFQLVEDDLYAFAIDKKQMTIRITPLKKMNNDSFAEALPNHILQPNIKEWIVIPDGKLAIPPVESWKVNNKYVLENWSCLYNTSATLYSRNKADDRLLSRDILAFAPIDFKEHQLSDLKKSEEEIQSIKKHLRVKPYMGKEAVVSKFLTELPNFSVIHLSTHAVMNQANPMKSALYFAKETQKDSGVIYAHQIFGLPLRAQLITLSACRTADSSGVLEGAQGIAAAFAYNGCSNILMSLWDVEDGAAMRIVSSFYQYLSEGKSKAEALRQAKLTYLYEADRYHKSPNYWAGIVLMGDHEEFDLGRSEWSIKWWIPALITLFFVVLYSSRWWWRITV